MYKLKKVWPPDMKSMSPQQQLRFEKKYKRRLKTATARPRWDKFVRLATLATTVCMIACSRHGFLLLFILTLSRSSCPFVHCVVDGLEGCPDSF